MTQLMKIKGIEVEIFADKWNVRVKDVNDSIILYDAFYCEDYRNYTEPASVEVSQRVYYFQTDIEKVVNRLHNQILREEKVKQRINAKNM